MLKTFFRRHCYEERPGQISMAELVTRAFEEEKSALIEAETGIGKSIAYLLPALLLAKETGEKIVISTYTIALQQQLLEKELPPLLEHLNLDLSVVLVKGMSNYLCLRKLQDPSVAVELPNYEPLLAWASNSEVGSQSDLPFACSSYYWQKVSAAADDCLYNRCPQFKECFFFKARKELNDADILIVNHHLLMADFKAKMAGVEQQAILPTYERLIVDEAHHFEEVALSSFSESLSMNQIKKLYQRADLSLAGLDCIELTPGRFTPTSSKGYQKLFDELKSQAALLSNSDDDEKKLCGDRLSKAGDFLHHFFTQKIEEDEVRWIENETMTQAKLQVARQLQDGLFKELKTAIFCSASLCVNGRFDYVRRALGFNAGDVFEERFDSPFNFKERVLLLSSTDFLEPNDPGFVSDISTTLLEAMRITRGGAFFLFTSYEMLGRCFEKLAPQLQREGLNPMQQGDLGRFALLEKFKTTPGAILFATDSFWEGVDVPGDALRCIVLVRLPFKVPSDPFYVARAEALVANGLDPFKEESLPQAVMKFKQGFGRLMRQKNDRGCILVLDRRLLTRSYGKAFLGSVPECQTCFGSKQKMLDAMRKFYGA